MLARLTPMRGDEMGVTCDPERLSEAIGAIYEAARDPMLWPDVMKRIQGLLGGSRACVLRFGAHASPADVLASDDFHAAHVEPDLLASVDGLVRRVARVPLGRVFSDTALHGPDVLRGSLFWREWMAPHDMYGGLGFRLHPQADAFWLFDVQRGVRQPSFGDDERRVVELLVPHLTRAFALQQELEASRLGEQAMDCVPTAVLVLDQTLRIRSANAAAEALLGRADVAPWRRAGRLVLSRRDEAEALRGLVRGACGVQASPWPDAGGQLMLNQGGRIEEALVLSVSPVGRLDGERSPFEPLAVVAIRPLGPRPAASVAQSLRSLFGLSPKEAWLADQLAGGASLREAAEEGGIAFSTARSYLEAIFAKTQTRRQGQLVALARSLETPLARR